MFSTDAILQTFGSIIGTMIGAFLGGYYAVRVVKKQIDFQKNLLVQDKNEKFEKTFWLIKVGFGVLAEAMVSASKTLSDPAIGDKPNYGYILGRLDSCLEQTFTKISDINNDYIPHEIYKTYLGGKTLLDGSKFIINKIKKRYFDSINSDRRDSFKIIQEEIKDMKSYGNGLVQLLTEIEEYRNKRSESISK